MVAVTVPLMTVPLMTVLLPAVLLVMAATPASAEWKAPVEAEGYKNIINSSAKSIEAGRKVYVKYCQICHGEKGDGKGASFQSLTVPPAAFNTKSSQSQSDGSLAWKILSGKGPMPSWAPVLSEDDIWNVINYIRIFAK
jgi:mono/diheme cytochrome c family protein